MRQVRSSSETVFRSESAEGVAYGDSSAGADLEFATILGVALGGVSITRSEVVTMLAFTVPGSIVFASMGLLLAQ